MFAATGSTIIAEIFARCAANAFSTAAKSLYGTLIVSAASDSGTPGHAAIPSVASPEPAFDKKESA